MSTTTDLSKFGYRELKMASELLNAMVNKGLPSDFDGDEVQLMMNQNSGNVFLVNEEYQVAMMNGDDLESFYTLSYSGIEGFANDLKSEYELGNITHEEDIEQLKELGIIEEDKEDEEDNE